jgi:ClpX C4-type zinc finger
VVPQKNATFDRKGSDMTVIGWGVRQFTRTLVRDDCAQLARSLKRIVTSGSAKKQAAIILQNIANDRPLCLFCGCARAEVKCLVESPFNPKVMICDWCATRAVNYARDTPAPTDEKGPAAAAGRPTDAGDADVGTS